MLGGLVYHLAVDPTLLVRLLTGAEEKDLGTFLEELLLLYCMEESGCLVGLPHFVIEEPFESNEIDFALVDSAGKGKLAFAGRVSAELNIEQLVPDRFLAILPPNARRNRNADLSLLAKNVRFWYAAHRHASRGAIVPVHDSELLPGSREISTVGSVFVIQAT
jgi:hypothetical protein